VPPGTFMFGAMALSGQWILNKSNRYRQDRILDTVSIEDFTVQTSPSTTNKGGVGSGILNVLPVHRADVDDYEARLRQKLQLIEQEQKVLQEEVLRRKRASTVQVQEKDM